MAQRALLLVVLLWQPVMAVAQWGGLEPARHAMDRGDWSDAVRLLIAHLTREDVAIEARYLRGIALAETGKYRTLQSRVRNTLQTAARDFELILEHDSLYRDVLYQYGRLRWFAGDLRSAIRLAEAQVRLKPDLAHARLGLHQFYWRYIMQTDPAHARDWLRAHPSALARLYTGETYTRQSLYQAAEGIFTGLLGRQHVDVPARIALARLYFAQGLPERGTAEMDQANAAIMSEADALLMFDTIKTIVTTKERSEFEAISSTQDYRLFFTVFWARRDPMPAAPYNARMEEHFRRLRVAERYHLFQGFRTWYRNQFTADATHFSSTYTLASDFDDQGIIFLRHGDPDDYTIGEANSWLYEEALLVFHFAPTCVGHICGVSRHFVPVPRGRSWGAQEVGHDWVEAERKSGDYLVEGLTTDRHQWPDGTTQLDVPMVTASFAGLGEETLVEVHYVIPENELRKGLDDRVNTVHVETGMTVHDQDWQRMGLFRQTKHLTGPYIGSFHLDLPPEPYHIGLHVRSLQTRHIGALRFEYDPRSYRGSGFKMSDLLLADSIMDLRGEDTMAREDVIVSVNVTGSFDVSAPVYVYFELYDLALAPDGMYRYSVDYSIRPENGREDAVTVDAGEQQSHAASLIEYVGIDIRDVATGRYQLVVAVHDRHGGTVVQRTRPLTVVR